MLSGIKSRSDRSLSEAQCAGASGTAAGITVGIVHHPRENVPDDLWDPTVTLHVALISDRDTQIGSGHIVRPATQLPSGQRKCG